MNAQTFVVLLTELYKGAFSLQRAKLSLSQDHKGLLLADAWSGNQAGDQGLALVRKAWSIENNVLLPLKMPGGWSARGQPVDQIHHLFRLGVQLIISNQLSVYEFDIRTINACI